MPARDRPLTGVRQDRHVHDRCAPLPVAAGGTVTAGLASEVFAIVRAPAVG